jgi:hypothetical protein
MPPRAPPKRLPFAFVLDQLDPLGPVTRPFFGAYGVYVDERIVFILREKGKDVDDGVWLATTAEHHRSLRAEFPGLRDIELFGPGPSGWQILRADLPDFEAAVNRACELVLARDPRIGKVPASRKPRPLKPKRTPR